MASPRSLPAPGPRLLAMWRRLAPLPGGRRLFAFLLGRFVPYSATLGAHVELLDPGHCRVVLRDHRAVRNHLDSVHAMALANLAELASGLAVVVGIPASVRGIVTAFTISYLKKARGRLRAECLVRGLSDVTSEQERDADVTITDAAGDVVARATARWRLRPAGV